MSPWRIGIRGVVGVILALVLAACSSSPAAKVKAKAPPVTMHCNYAHFHGIKKRVPR